MLSTMKDENNRLSSASVNFSADRRIFLSATGYFSMLTVIQVVSEMGVDVVVAVVVSRWNLPRVYLDRI